MQAKQYLSHTFSQAFQIFKWVPFNFSFSLSLADFFLELARPSFGNLELSPLTLCVRNIHGGIFILRRWDMALRVYSLENAVLVYLLVPGLRPAAEWRDGRYVTISFSGLPAKVS